MTGHPLTPLPNEEDVLAAIGDRPFDFASMQAMADIDRGEMEIGRLAVECDLSEGTLTGILNTLEGRGLVVRERMDSDRRRMLVALTADGEQMIETLSPNFHRFETETSSSLDDDEKRELASLLRRVIVDTAGDRN